MNSDVLHLFIDFPGNLLYFLVVIGVSQAAFFIALDQRLRQERGNGAARLALGAAGATVGWVALLAGALLALSGQQVSNAILPPLERAVNLWVLAWTGWAFLSAEAGGRYRGWLSAGLVVTLALVAAGYVVTAPRWNALAADMRFNESAFALPWTFVPVVLGALGVLLLLLSNGHTRDVPLKILFFAALIAGYGVALGQLAAGDLRGDYAGSVRLGMLAAMPVYLAVVYRYVIYRLTAPPPPEVAAEPRAGEADVETPPAGVPALDVKPGAAAEFWSTEKRPALEVEAAMPELPPAEAVTDALNLMLAQPDPDQVPYQTALAIATALKADVVVLLRIDEHWADVMAAYDHIRQRPISGLALNLNEQPTLVEATTNRRQATLVPHTHGAELVDLFSRLDISQTGPAYIQPMVRAEKSVGAIVVALPFSGRLLTDREQDLLEQLGTIAAGVLALSDAAIAARFAAESAAEAAGLSPLARAAREDVTAEAARKELEEAREQIGELTDLVRNLQIELDYERSRLAARELGDEEGLTLSQQMEALRAEREQLAAERDRLHEALAEAQTTLTTVTAEDNAAVLQGMVELLSREKQELEARYASMKVQLEQLSQSATAPDAIAQMLQSLTEETERLAAERDQIAAELHDVNAQLEALGIEGGTGGLAQWLGQLYDERTRLIEQTRQLLAEREASLNAEEIEGRVLMRGQIERLANDREALTVQRDALRRERDDLARQLADAQARADAIAQARDRLADQLARAEVDLQKAGALGLQLGRQRDELKAKLAQLEAERDQLLAERATLEPERDRLRAALEGREEALKSLNVELQSVEALRGLVAQLGQQRTALEAELTAARADATFLQEQLRATEEQLRATEAAVETSVREAEVMRRQRANDDAEVIASIAQELRTPMSSIMGYTDLLLSESVGILGAMQRNFLQRVRANTERMGTLLDDLIRVAVMESGRAELAPESMNVIDVIEAAIMGSGSQFREKDITLRLDMADDLPAIRADRDAFQQIVAQLLSNACLASPVHGEVVLAARQERCALPGPGGEPRETECLLVSVRDQGGGVAPEDIERVFSRKYRADNPLVAGLGDTGVGLSIAKALVEAHGGRIWLSSEPGVGSTFAFALPLEPIQPQES